VIFNHERALIIVLFTKKESWCKWKHDESIFSSTISIMLSDGIFSTREFYIISRLNQHVRGRRVGDEWKKNDAGRWWMKLLVKKNDWNYSANKTYNLKLSIMLVIEWRTNVVICWSATARAWIICYNSVDRSNQPAEYIQTGPIQNTYISRIYDRSNIYAHINLYNRLVWHPRDVSNYQLLYVSIKIGF
jgi:hypothetical protein